ncbi:MAG: DUF2029 domain-containing protein [Chloroflexi bacterium]|nr:DUF2029 domain-containing protein [Chloroflexota bacterium]
MSILRTDKVHIYILLIAIVGMLTAYYHSTGLTPRLFGFSPYSDILIFYDEAVEPGLPYIDKLIEYPVITGLFIHAAGVLGKTYGGYYLFNSFFLIAFAILATYLLYRSIDNKDKRALFVYWVFAPSMFFFLIYNWDMLAIIFVVIAFYLIRQNKAAYSASFLSLGFCAKLYPVFYLLPLLLTRSIKQWPKIIVVFVLVALAINGYFMLSNFDGWSHFITFNSQRSPNPDSIWAVVNTLVPSLSNTQINILSLVIFLSLSLVAVWKCRHDSVIKLCFILTLIFLISNKVFSPQYLMWLLPFYVLLDMKKKGLFYALELVNLIVFFTITRHYTNSSETVLLNTCHVFVVIRHVLLVYMLYYLLRRPSHIIYETDKNV